MAEEDRAGRMPSRGGPGRQDAQRRGSALCTASRQGQECQQGACCPCPLPGGLVPSAEDAVTPAEKGQVAALDWSGVMKKLGALF